jgi:hypothetical protein
MTNGYSTRFEVLSGRILHRAEELRDAADGPVLDAHEVDRLLIELKDLIRQCEEAMPFIESPYPGEIMLGTTPPGDDGWVEMLCSGRYGQALKEIRIRRTGHRARYLRINDIEITYRTPGGLKTTTFNKNGRAKLRCEDVFKLALPRPMKVRRVRIHVEHESTGLEVTGIPYDLGVRPGHGHVERHGCPDEVQPGSSVGVGEGRRIGGRRVIRPIRPRRRF